MIRYRGGGKWEVVEWKNLHFRPPILKDKVVNGVGSDKLLIRIAGLPETTETGYILILNDDSSSYQICGRGIKVHKVIPSQIEWMEVPK